MNSTLIMASEKKKRKDWGKDRKGKESFLGHRRGYGKGQSFGGGFFNGSKRQAIKNAGKKEVENMDEKLKYIKRFNEEIGSPKVDHDFDQEHKNAQSHIVSLQNSINFIQKVHDSIVSLGVADEDQLRFIEELHELCSEDFFELK